MVEYLLLGTSPPNGVITLEEVFVTTRTEAFPFALSLKPTTILRNVASLRWASKLYRAVVHSCRVERIYSRLPWKV